MNRVAVVYSGGRHWGGIETYLHNLFRLYKRDEMQLVLLSLGRWELSEELERIGVSQEIRVLTGRRLSFKAVWGIRRITLDEGASLVVSQGVVANAYARLAALLARLPHLTVVHSDLKLDYPSALRRYAYQLSDRLLRPVTKDYIAVSGYLKERLVRSGIRSGRVHVVYNGVDMAADRAGAVRAGVDLDPDGAEGGVRLVSVGRLHRVKNFDSLVRAMRLLPDRVRLTVWGEGEERAALGALVEELGLGGRVRFPGESENMEQALQMADVYLQPSWSEGCSFAVAEAMLQGRPTVVTPYGGLPEQVQDGVTGVVTKDGSPEELARAIELLVSDRGLVERLGQAGKEAAEDMYCMDKWLSETTLIFREAAKESDCVR